MGLKDIAINESTSDIDIVGGSMYLNEGRRAVAQSHRISFGTFLGEWFIDLLAGFDWRGLVLVKNPDIASIDAAMKLHILDRKHTIGIRSFLSEFDQAARDFGVTYTAITDLGDITAVSIPSEIAPWGFVLLFPGLGPFME